MPRSPPTDLDPLLDADRLADDVLEGLDRGELLARRFRHVAATALMVLRNPEPGRQVRVGGLHWVSTRLYPLVRAACPDHPLLRQTRREVLDECSTSRPHGDGWRPGRRSGSACCRASRRSPPPGSSRRRPKPSDFESPGDALRRLQAAADVPWREAGAMRRPMPGDRQGQYG